MKPILFLLAVVTLPLHAGTISLDVSGVLGPLFGGSDPLKLAGQSFTLAGLFDANLAPVSVTADSATYALPVNLQIAVGALYLTGYNADLTITTPPSGPDTVTLDFSVIQSNFSPDVYASLSLPAGTFSGPALRDFSA